MAEDWEQGGFGIYVHWPFCASKCPYCDFNSHVAAEIDESRWVRAYLSEIDRYADEVSGRVVNSVFFGGGTPSLMAPETVSAILERIHERWPQANNVEVTLEANPTSVEAGRFRGYGQAGVNRLSMGIQALNNHDLRALGRLHTVEEGLAAFETARQFFDRVSFDLIYARQDQSLKEWQAELRRALDLAVDHLSLYQLTIEPGTAFGDRYDAGKLRGLPEDDLAGDMYEATQEICDTAGLEAYEVSNHAKTGSESRHNLIYWRYGDYIGIGPGAHGRLTVGGQKFATETALSPNEWLNAADAGNGEALRRALSGAEQAEEYLMMGLRITQGIDLKRFSISSGRVLDAEKLSHLAEIGMVDITPNNLRVTPSGRMVLNAVIKELFAD
ncbi:radical SAM family heme chaperone HemW [Alisedimentitalea sp. MJ-SS2]|uniref:radical SAM family heme chaperone HemW n=1 Tax=Aliisedimentitalea sp. MJ-SS2 TaxID=3049795 RepID=UPI0029110580|nr:radical SAM family heme chaperone HemW [Alisedimentitalea sp. MJ-SS2]MDU8927983.1 radical SAM family heme chaperone HemW [Alisedimentitalea sp. MJ-SS2]